MQVEFDDTGTVAVKVRLQIQNRTISVLPNGGFEERRIRKSFVTENLGMYTCDQHLFIIGSVENADSSPFRKISRGAPKKIVEQLSGAGMLEAEHLASLWIDPGHHMPDRTIFPGRVHRLKDQQDGVTVGCIMQPLQLAKLLDV